ncbi:TPA: endopeptidase La [Candidatus Dependentiae bacterium]|nr:endopeptidase La [Candidatus Dependentiae bacterium]
MKKNEINDIPTVEHVSAVLHEENGNSRLPLMPLKNVVLLPKSIVPLVVGRIRSVRAIEYALRNQKELCVVTQKDPALDEPSKDDLFKIGTRAAILQVMPMPKGNLKVLLEGIARTEIDEIDETSDLWLASCGDLLTHEKGDEIEIQALWRYLKTLYKNYAQTSGHAPTSVVSSILMLENIAVAADTITAHSGLNFKDRQTILETMRLKDRLELLISLLERENDIIKTEERIRGRVQTQVEKNQREYYLHEQIKAIHKELGRDEQLNEASALREQADATRLPAAVMQKVERELRRLEQMPPLSAEASISKNYIDWIFSLPWHEIRKDRISLDQAKKILDRDHFGLQKIKERVLEFIAAKKFNPTLSRSPIICLVGPPGVGKTSLAHSIAAALGREFVRISLGGIRDESEIRGHRRTYVGAMPGKIIQGMSSLKTTNPVILLDEIDKMSHDMFGDPASALLEVLDPEQNSSFVDNFLEVGYDLSHVMFITTANHPEGIPYPLFDRMEVITLSGYTNPEKLQIARKFLIPKALREYGVSKEQCSIPKPTLNLVIDEYTREAGVRQLERLIGKLVRKSIQQMISGKDASKKAEKTEKSVEVSPSMCKEWLGLAPFKRKLVNASKTLAGCATGLAWTELGGDVLEVEAAIIPGKGELTLTGQLGDVMRESAQAAVSYVRSRSADLGLKKNFFSTNDIHVHVPEGATPKDGPSAGITICTALVSAATQTPLKPAIAMTGEITLRGNVLPVGGLKEKLIAAQQQMMTTVLVPKDNEEEVRKIEEELKSPFTTHFVKSMDEVLELAFQNNPLKKT